MPEICLEKWNRERDLSIYINKIGLEIDLQHGRVHQIVAKLFEIIN